MLDFAHHHNLTIANTLHSHKSSRRITWHSPNGKNHNQIDFILVSKRYDSEIDTTKTKSFPGADIGSDHDMVLMTLIRLIKIEEISENQKSKE